MSFLPLDLIRNIRTARKESGLTQAQMAEKLDISELYYGRLERGESCISLQRLAQIADALDVSAYSLLDCCFCGTPKSSIPNDCADIATLAAACSQDGQRLIRDVARLIANDYDI